MWFIFFRKDKSNQTIIDKNPQIQGGSNEDLLYCYNQLLIMLNMTCDTTQIKEDVLKRLGSVNDPNLVGYKEIALQALNADDISSYEKAIYEISWELAVNSFNDEKAQNAARVVIADILRIPSQRSEKLGPALEIAKAALETRNPIIIIPALNLLTTIIDVSGDPEAAQVALGIALQVVFPTVKEALESKDPEAVQQALESVDPEIIIPALNLLTTIIDVIDVIEDPEAAQVALGMAKAVLQAALGTRNEKIIIAALNLLTNSIIISGDPKGALQITEQALGTRNEKIIIAALNLLTTIIDVTEDPESLQVAFEMAKAALYAALESKNPVLLIAALNLLTDSIDVSENPDTTQAALGTAVQVIQPVLEIAVQRVLESGDSKVIIAALNLLTTIIDVIEDPESLQVALGTAVHQALESKDPEAAQTALNLLTDSIIVSENPEAAQVALGIALQVVFPTVKEALESKDPEAVQVAISAVQQSLESGNPEVGVAALNLLTVIKSVTEIPDITQPAPNPMTDSTSVSENSESLQQAISAVQQAENSEPLQQALNLLANSIYVTEDPKIIQPVLEIAVQSIQQAEQAGDSEVVIAALNLLTVIKSVIKKAKELSQEEVQQVLGKAKQAVQQVLGKAKQAVQQAGDSESVQQALNLLADSIYVIEKVEVKSIFDIAIQVVQQGGDSESVQQALNLMADSINLISSTTNIDDVSKRALEAAKPILGTGDLKVVTAALNLIAVIISVNHDKFVNTKDLIQAILNRNEEKLNFVFNTYDV